MGSEDWVELQIDVGPELAEVVAAELSELCGGAELRDEDTLLAAPAARARVVTQLRPEQVAAALALVETCWSRALAAGSPEPRPAIAQRAAHESEWRDVWKQYFRATRLAPGLWVRPSWDAQPVPDGDRAIELDPGRAFGTGAHATTRLVIELCVELARQGLPVARFLDLGCGSGILAIAAALLWPGAHGLAVDIDPEAAACSAENLARNRIAGVRTRVGTLADVLADAPGHGVARASAAAGPTPAFDLVLANIEAPVLSPLARALATAVAPGGRLLLSGILDEQGEAVAAAYRATGFSVRSRPAREGWTALELVRTEGPPRGTG